MNHTLNSILAAAKRAGLAHNGGAGGEHLLCASGAQLLAFATAIAEPPAPAEPVYGSTDLGYQIMDPRVTDGAKRLMKLVTDLFGNDSPAFADLEALVDCAPQPPRPGTAPLSGTQLEALAKKHGATSYRNRADTQHPAYGFTEAGLLALIAEVRSAAKADPFVPFQALQDAFGRQSPACWCSACDSAANGGMRSRMSVCPACGDKRCPRALHHERECDKVVGHGQPT